MNTAIEQQDDTSRQLGELMKTRQYVIRHRCGQPVLVLPTRDRAQAVADRIETPVRYQCRVSVATESDMLATLTQRHCTHVPRPPAS